jgi:hypothetical protein
VSWRGISRCSRSYRPTGPAFDRTRPSFCQIVELTIFIGGAGDERSAVPIQSLANIH